MENAYVSLKGGYVSVLMTMPFDESIYVAVPDDMEDGYLGAYKVGEEGMLVLDKGRKAELIEAAQKAEGDFAQNQQQAEMVTSQERRALQLFAQSVTDEAVMMEMGYLYPAWEKLVELGSACASGTICRYGVNEDNEPQLYSFVQDYVPVAHYAPDSDATHYKKIGFAEDGHAIWTQPYGETDAYRVGDVRWHKGVLWECVDADANGNNTWEPGVFGWKKVVE